MSDQQMDAGESLAGYPGEQQEHAGVYGGDPLERQVAALADHAVNQHIETQAAQLVQDFPELAQQENAEALIQTAQAEAERLGRPDLADDPRFWRQMHLARQGVASLEASRPQTVEEFVDSVIPAKLSSGPLPF